MFRLADCDSFVWRKKSSLSASSFCLWQLCQNRKVITLCFSHFLLSFSACDSFVWRRESSLCSDLLQLSEEECHHFLFQSLLAHFLFQSFLLFRLAACDSFVWRRKSSLSAKSCCLWQLFQKRNINFCFSHFLPRLVDCDSFIRQGKPPLSASVIFCLHLLSMTTLSGEESFQFLLQSLLPPSRCLWHFSLKKKVVTFSSDLLLDRDLPEEINQVLFQSLFTRTFCLW